MKNKVIKDLLEFRYRTNLFFDILEDNNYFDLDISSKQVKDILRESILQKQLIVENKLARPLYLKNKKMLKEGGIPPIRAALEASRVAAEAARAAEAAKAAEAGKVGKNTEQPKLGNREPAKDVEPPKEGTATIELAPEVSSEDLEIFTRNSFEKIREFIRKKMSEGTHTPEELLKAVDAELNTYKFQVQPNPEILKIVEKIKYTAPEIIQTVKETMPVSTTAAEILGVSTPKKSDDLTVRISDTESRTQPITEPEEEPVIPRIPQEAPYTPRIPQEEPYTPQIPQEEPVTPRIPQEAPYTPPKTDPITDPRTDPSTDPTTEPTTDPTTEPTTDPITDPITDPTRDPITDPRTDPTTDTPPPPRPTPPEPPKLPPPPKPDKENPWLLPLLSFAKVDSSPYTPEGQGRTIDLGLGIEAMGKYAVRQVMK